MSSIELVDMGVVRPPGVGAESGYFRTDSLCWMSIWLGAMSRMDVMKSPFQCPSSPTSAVWLLCVIGLTSIFAGCGTKTGNIEARPFSINSVMKSDLHILVETHQRQTLNYLRELTVKLYRRNPRELNKTGRVSLHSRVGELFDSGRHIAITKSASDNAVSEVTAGIDPRLTLDQVFDVKFQDDRVYALADGLHAMVMRAYNNKESFYLLDQPLDPQRFHNTARNIEILLWRLKSERRPDGSPWLVTNATGHQVNLSYERLFGKLIAQMDMMAVMVAQSRNIQIKNLMRQVASAVFLPV